MTLRRNLSHQAVGLMLGSVVGLLCGSASALFLWLLELATTTRGHHMQLVYALPIMGLAMGFVLERFGSTILGGNNLVLDTIHTGGAKIPLRMVPMVLLGTVATHLCGGSAGREGTAVQMGASLADWVAQRCRLSLAMRQHVLVAGVAGGFASVFGTPVAGIVFGLEFLVLGRLEYRALIPAVAAAVVGNWVTLHFGIVHTPYPIVAAVALTPLLVGKWLLFAAAMAGAAWVFIELTHWLKRQGQRFIPRLGYRMAVGGVLVVILWQVMGTDDYLGLGIPMIIESFTNPDLGISVFALKILFTAITLSAGFLGGEVTPLFFVGSTLGCVLARWLGIPIELGAGVGLAAVFAAAANAPLALSIMAVELMGAALFPHVLIVSAIAYVLVGHRSIYTAQRLHHHKDGSDQPQPIALRDVH